MPALETSATATPTEATPAVATPVAPKAPKPKAKPAAKAKPAPAKKAAPVKAKPAVKAKQETTDDPKTKAIRWSEKKVALLAALNKLNATNSGSAVTPEKIASTSKGKALTTLNPSFDLTQQGYIGAAKHEGQTGLCWYITSKGQTVLKKQSA